MNKMFCTLFLHFHTSTMVPGEALYSMPIPLPCTNPVGMSPRSSKVVSKTKQFPSPVGKKGNTKTVPLPLGS